MQIRDNILLKTNGTLDLHYYHILSTICMCFIKKYATYQKARAHKLTDDAKMQLIQTFRY